MTCRGFLRPSETVHEYSEHRTSLVVALLVPLDTPLVALPPLQYLQSSSDAPFTAAASFVAS